ncbi:hypothetical protein C8R46DRAFT_894908 [Mycena filopes]|nr:hypothetical protein C8R46DRAFT_894908 [Mycena filopes]
MLPDWSFSQESPYSRSTRIHSDPKNPIGAPFILQSKPRGISLLNTAYDPALWKSFDYHVFIPELATAFAQVFDAPSLSEIGEVGPSGSETSSVPPIVGPFQACEQYSGPGGPFATAEELVSHLTASLYSNPSDSYFPNTDVQALLDRLVILACRLPKHLEHLDPLLVAAFRPAHLDPHDRNVLVHDGHFAGLVDWQASPPHSFLQDILSMPACIAAQFPPYIRSDGMYEPRYAALNEHGDIDHMNPNSFALHPASPFRPTSGEAQLFRQTYLEAASAASPLYGKALQEGQTLRQLLEWLNFVDWDGDFVWAGLELWESDQRNLLDRMEREAPLHFQFEYFGVYNLIAIAAQHSIESSEIPFN